MDALKKELEQLAKLWKNSQPDSRGSARPPVHPSSFTPALMSAYRAISGAQVEDIGTLAGVSGSKSYVVFSDRRGRKESRPFLTRCRFESETALEREWQHLLQSLDPKRCAVVGTTPDRVDRILYAAAHYVACAFDIFTGNRASAGKFFEYLTGSLVLNLCAAQIAPLPRLSKPPDYAVPVDLVVKSSKRDGFLILASKITTRERIVQPFVHHLMVSRAHPGRYKTLILCGSETNRLQDERGLQETCVAGTIEAYRETLGNVDGIYYLDLPRKYKTAEFASAFEVSTIGELLCTGLRRHYGPTGRPTAS